MEEIFRYLLKQKKKKKEKDSRKKRIKYRLIKDRAIRCLNTF